MRVVAAMRRRRHHAGSALHEGCNSPADRQASVRGGVGGFRLNMGSIIYSCLTYDGGRCPGQ